VIRWLPTVAAVVMAVATVTAETGIIWLLSQPNAEGPLVVVVSVSGVVAVISAALAYVTMSRCQQHLEG
jgi:hypothetical protein